METATPYILFFTAIGIIGAAVLGFIIGWFGNEIVYQFLSKNSIQPLHPEMFDANGNLVPDEILAVRFENSENHEDYEDED